MLNIMNHYGIESQNIMKYHLAPVKIAIARKTRSNTVGKEKEKKKKRNPCSLMVRVYTGIAIIKITKV